MRNKLVRGARWWLVAGMFLSLAGACGGADSDGDADVHVDDANMTDGGIVADSQVADPDGSLVNIGDAAVVPPPEASPLDDTCATALTGPFEESLPVPDDFVAAGDDFSARLSWGGPLAGTNQDNERFGSAVEGYRVCWGASQEELTHAVLSTNRMVSIYGVPNDAPQVAVVQSVDMFGNVSRPSEVITFSGDPSRVEQLAQKMTGFFDRLNKPGPLDELKWNVAFSQCNDPTASHTYIDDRGHAVSVLGNYSGLPGSEGGCDRDQNIARPRAVFDFADREGTVVFDFDGSDGDRSTWYLDFFPYEGPESVIDITGHVSFDEGQGHPGRFLRISQAGSRLKIHQYDRQGEPINVEDVTYYWDAADKQLLPGEALRHFEIKVSKNFVSVAIDGEVLIENSDIELDFERAYLHWAQFNYNPAKIGRPWNMLHWDNFGFDGPRDNVVTHNYKSSFNRDDRTHVGWPEHEGQWTVNIPDSLDGATGARFFYTLQTHAYSWSSEDKFVLNGTAFAMPEPLSEAGTWQDAVLAHSYPPASMSVEVPLEVLKQGANQFDFSAENSTLLNMHVEVYFARRTEPSFTQPMDMLSMSPLPNLLPQGPMAWINRVNGEYNRSGWTLSGQATFDVVAENWLQALMFGHNLGVARVEILVDEEVAAFADTNAAVAAPGVYDGPFSWNQNHEGGIPIVLDTTKLSNGEHTLRVRAYDSAGNTGRPGDWKEDDEADFVTFTVQN